MTATPTEWERAGWQAFAAALTPKPVGPRRWDSPLDLACELDPKMVRTPALELINRKLVAQADGKGRTRLAVFLSPQEGKSTLCSYWYPVWLLLDDPEQRIIIISYSGEIALRWGAEIKRALETYNGDEGTVDLGLRLRADSRASGRWQLEGHKGGVYCAGVGGQITGRPGDRILVDDPLKNLEEAQSAKYRDRGMRTWQGVLIPRMAPHTTVTWIQTLWHESEPIMQILANEGANWDVVRIPAICDSPDDPLGRAIGEPMVSARGYRDWAKIRHDVGEYVFAALYQQRPAPAEGGLFKRLWFRYWTPAPADGRRDRLDLAGRVWPVDECWRFITVDLAASTRTSADFTVAAAWALTLDGDLVLLDRVRAKVGEANHFDLVRPLAARWRVDTAFVEATQHSMTLTAEATRSGLHVTPLKAETDKFSRALPYSARASAGRVWLPAGASWLEEWVSEHASFPNGSHDDQVDVGSYAVRVAVTKWVPPVPKPAAPRPAEDDGPDFMNMSF
ncbi:MAG TPA: phage terminase large subunit [Micromonosporaceae bacterium]|nr:phage terminase large subunit [Micromonosporaceae bacterium]